MFRKIVDNCGNIVEILNIEKNINGGINMENGRSYKNSIGLYWYYWMIKRMKKEG